MKKLTVFCLSLLMMTVMFASVTLTKSDFKANGTWYNCYPNVEFYGNLGTISSLTVQYKMEFEFVSTGLTSAVIAIEVDNIWLAEDLALVSTEGNKEYWSTDEIVIDISGLPIEGSHEIRFSASYRDGTGTYYDPEIMYYDKQFSIAEAPMPVTLASFTAQAVKGNVELNWTTESETENAHFLVYRDGEVIAQVEGNGTTTETHSYKYTDTRVRVGNYNYAIADVSYGGEITEYAPVNVEIENGELEAEDFVLNMAYPNPFNPSITINYELSTINRVRASIYRVNGELVADILNEDMSVGTHEVTWDASNMSSGVYIVKMIAGDVVRSQKIVLMK